MTQVPYFSEYRVYAEGLGAQFIEIPEDPEHFHINFEQLEKLISPKTKGIIINSPNNPSGAVFPPEVIQRFCDFLRQKEAEYGHQIFIISDEPYRELVYDEDTVVPYIPCEYEDTIVCYSYSKSLSLPGERLGYIFVNPAMKNADEVAAAINGAGRVLGYICAPSMMQKTISLCQGLTSDISVYKRNRDLLYNALTEYGFDCIYPDGAFYLFMKAPGGDTSAFLESAKKYGILFVPSESFGCSGYVRIAYCVSTEMIEESLPLWKKLAADVIK